jgi:hypothetical protein
LCRCLNRLATCLLTASALGLLGTPGWAQQVQRTVPEPPAGDSNLAIYAYIVMGVLALGIAAVGFKGTKGGQ